MPKILLVEDNELNRDMLSRWLTRNGFDVAIAVDGRQGIREAEEQVPELILMDLSLPEIDGWEATKILKSRPRTCAVPIMALTAHATTSDRQRALDAGCDDFSTKPIEFANLLTKINNLLERKDKVR